MPTNISFGITSQLRTAYSEFRMAANSTNNTTPAYHMAYGMQILTDGLTYAINQILTDIASLKAQQQTASPNTQQQFGQSASTKFQAQPTGGGPSGAAGRKDGA